MALQPEPMQTWRAGIRDGPAGDTGDSGVTGQDRHTGTFPRCAAKINAEFIQTPRSGSLHPLAARPVSCADCYRFPQRDRSHAPRRHNPAETIGLLRRVGAADRRQPALGCDCRTGSHLDRHRAGQLHRTARPVRLRQDHLPANRCRPGNRHRRPGGDCRSRRHRPAAGCARRCDGVPVLRPVPTFERRGEHRLRSEGAQRCAAGARASAGACGGDPRHWHTCWTASRASFPAANSSVWLSVAPSWPRRRSASWTNRCRTSMRSFARTCDAKFWRCSGGSVSPCCT